MSDDQTLMFIRGVVSIIILSMFWNVSLAIIDLIKFALEQRVTPTDVAIVCGPVTATLGVLLGYAFKLLHGRQ